MKCSRHPLALTALAVLTTQITDVEAATLGYFSDPDAFHANTSTTVVEDFESIFPKDAYLSTFSSNGITYTALGSAPFTPNLGIASPGYRNFGIPITTSSILTASGDEDFRLDFSTPYTAIGFDTYLNQYGPASVSIFGNDGLLSTYTLEQDPSIIGFLGIVSSEPMTGLRWTTVNGRAINTGLDNIRVGTTNAEAVPEPATIGGILVAGVGLMITKLRQTWRQ